MKRQNQKGFTLVELVLVLALVGLAMFLQMRRDIAELEQMQARQLGVEVYQIVQGTSEYIASYSGNTAVVSGNESHTDLGFLKDPENENSGTCGASSDDNGDGEIKGDEVWVNFVPCNFLPDNKTTFGKLGFTVDITRENSAELSYKIKFDKLELDSQANGGTKVAGSLSGLAALVASGSTFISSGPAGLSKIASVEYCATSAPDACDASDVGHIVAVSNSNSGSQMWLRVDHGNKMQNILEFNAEVDSADDTDNMSLRRIMNVARIYNDVKAGGLEGQLILGNDGNFDFKSTTDSTKSNDTNAMRTSVNSLYGTSISAKNLVDAGVVIDTDLALYEDLIALQNAFVHGNLVVGENLVVNEDFNVKGESDFDGDVRMKSHLNVDGSLIVKQDSYMEGDLEVFGTVQGDLFYDDDDSTFRVDPDKQSVMHNIKANELEIDKIVVNDYIEAPMFLDKDNNSYYMDPSQTSIINNLSANGVVNLLNANVYLPEDTRINVRGVATRLEQILPKYSHMATYQVQNGGYVPWPSCPNSYSRKIVVTTKGVDMVVKSSSTTGSWTERTGYEAFALSNGSGWRVYIRGLVGGSGVALAHTYCYVPH